MHPHHINTGFLGLRVQPLHPEQWSIPGRRAIPRGETEPAPMNEQMEMLRKDQVNELVLKCGGRSYRAAIPHRFAWSLHEFHYLDYLTSTHQA